MTDPQQSTVETIFRPVSPRKRQAMQGKPIVLSPISTQTSSHLRKHRTSVPSRLQKLTGTVIRTKSAPQATPSHSHTPDAPSGPPQPHPRRTPPSTPALPPHPSHTPDVHLSPQIRMQFPNRSDSVVQSDTNKQGVQRELHAKLQHLRPLAGPVATPHGGHRAQAATHPDR